MASMCPNPFILPASTIPSFPPPAPTRPTPLQTTASPPVASPVSRGPTPVPPSPLAVAPSRPVMLPAAPAVAPPVASPPHAVAPTLLATASAAREARPAASPAISPLARPLPSAAVASPTPSLVAWTERTARTDVPPAESTGMVRAALLKVRQSRLARVVKGVVGVSAVVCLLAAGRAAVGNETTEAEASQPGPRAARPPVRAAIPAKLVPLVDALSERTLEAINGDDVKPAPQPAAQAARHPALHRHKRR